MNKKDFDKPELNRAEMGTDPVEEAEVRDIAGEVVESGGWLRRLALLLPLLLLTLVAAGSVFGYQYWKQMQDTLLRMEQVVQRSGEDQHRFTQDLEQIRGAFEQQKLQLQAQQQALLVQEQKLYTEQASLRKESAEMRSALESVHLRIGRSSTQWMAAEAAYLLQVADHRLRLDADLATAIGALEAADGRLRDTGDPSWIGVREIIAAEITRLKGIDIIDRAGLSIRFSGLAQQVRGLKIGGTEPLPEAQRPGVARATSEPAERSWKTVLNDGWAGFKSVMVVRHHGKQVNAMLPPDQQYFVYQNLRLQLEAARMSLLRGDQPLYDASLEIAGQWLEEFFDGNDPATRSMQREIGELKQIVVQPALPDVSASLIALRERLRQQAEEGERE